jgi:hypothetical protein
MSKYTTWEDTARSDYCEVTLHGPRIVQDKRIKFLTEAAKKYRVSDPEKYLCLMNMATQIADQVYFNKESD